jgi:hypothetical protein
MAIGFGFSVGDLIAVGKLAHDIANALSDCRGASAEYRTLVEVLGSLKMSLSLISNFTSTLAIAKTSRVDQAFMNGILFHAGCCYKLLNQFMVRFWLHSARQISRSIKTYYIVGRLSEIYRKLSEWTRYQGASCFPKTQVVSLQCGACPAA